MRTDQGFSCDNSDFNLSSHLNSLAVAFPHTVLSSPLISSHFLSSPLISSPLLPYLREKISHSGSYHQSTYSNLLIPFAFRPDSDALLPLEISPSEKHSFYHASLAKSYGNEGAITLDGTSSICWPEKRTLGRGTFT